MLHSQVFGGDSVRNLATHCEIAFASESELTRATWEWFYFGLHAVVEGVQNNFRNEPEVGQEIVRAVFAELKLNLTRVGFTAEELNGKLAVIKDRFNQFGSIDATGEYERIGFAAAKFVFDLDIAPGKYGPTINAHGFGLAANQTYIGTLNAINRMFDSIKI